MTQDFSVSNRMLHRLYIIHAQEDLQDFQKCIGILAEHSRVNRSSVANLIREERSKLILSNFAYQEAAWRILAENLIIDESKGDA